MNYFWSKSRFWNYIGFYLICSYSEIEQTTSDSSEYSEQSSSDESSGSEERTGDSSEYSEESSSDESSGSEESNFEANEENADEQRNM